MYDIPREFNLKSKINGSPKYTFGSGRDVCRIPKLTDSKNTPGPSSYRPYKDFGANGLHYSMSFRYNRPNPNSKNPGPGTYSYQQINEKGIYGSSELRNSPQAKFPTAKRFVYNYNKNPGPGTYKNEELINGKGIVYNSRYTTNLGKTMGKRLYQVGVNLVTPGPGAYNYFSDFEGFGNFQFQKLKKSASTGDIHSK